tara:strand:+ start:819 stop:935 length:117 start_codon:yes stop_codon:yes gene_type:complete
MVEDWNDLAHSDDKGKPLTQILIVSVVAIMVMVFFLGM